MSLVLSLAVSSYSIHVFKDSPVGILMCVRKDFGVSVTGSHNYGSCYNLKGASAVGKGNVTFNNNIIIIHGRDFGL